MSRRSVRLFSGNVSKVVIAGLFVALAAGAAWARKTAAAVTTPPADYLAQAKHGVETLQMWYTQDTGLYQTTGWWNAGNAITVLADDSRVSGSEAYLPVFANTFVQAQKRFAGFLNNYYDDEGWWALAWVDVYDLTKKPEYLAMAASIFADMSGGWDATCGGGIWWSKDRNYKNAIANELFLSVAAHLAARATDAAKRAEYLGWARKEWAWFAHSGMINEQSLVNDGLTAACRNNQRTVWTYNQGVALGGLAELNKVTPDKSLITSAQALAGAALAHMTDANGVLHDTCEPDCGGDGVQFKGIFVRNLVALDQTEPDPRYKTFVDANARSIWENSQGPGYQLGLVWTGPFDAGNAASQASALDALVGAAEIEKAVKH